MGLWCGSGFVVKDKYVENGKKLALQAFYFEQIVRGGGYPGPLHCFSTVAADCT